MTDLNISKEWFEKCSAAEGDLEIGAGGRKTLTINLTADEISVLEQLVNPEAAAQRARNVELCKTIEHWCQEVGKLHSQIDSRNDTIRETLSWVRHWQEDVAANLKPTPESLASMEAKLVAVLERKP